MTGLFAIIDIERRFVNSGIEREAKIRRTKYGMHFNGQWRPWRNICPSCPHKFECPTCVYYRPLTYTIKK